MDNNSVIFMRIFSISLSYFWWKIYQYWKISICNISLIWIVSSDFKFWPNSSYHSCSMWLKLLSIMVCLEPMLINQPTKHLYLGAWAMAIGNPYQLFVVNVLFNDLSGELKYYDVFYKWHDQPCSVNSNNLIECPLLESINVHCRNRCHDQNSSSNSRGSFNANPVQQM